MRPLAEVVNLIAKQIVSLSAVASARTNETVVPILIHNIVTERTVEVGFEDGDP